MRQAENGRSDVRWLGVLVLALSGCGGAKFDAAEDRVRDFLRDPESAQFRNMREVAGGVCGEYNAKNAMGGYAGFRPFKWAEETNFVVALDENGRTIRLDDPNAIMFQSPQLEAYCADAE
jgi:hypothetical protein